MFGESKGYSRWFFTRDLWKRCHLFGETNPGNKPITAIHHSDLTDVEGKFDTSGTSSDEEHA